MTQSYEYHPERASSATASLSLAIWASTGQSHCDKYSLRRLGLHPAEIVEEHAVQGHKPLLLVSPLVHKTLASVASWGTNAFPNRTERPPGPLNHCFSVGYQ